MACYLDAIEVRHADVDHGHIWFQFNGLFHGLAPVRCLANNLPAASGAEDRPCTTPLSADPVAKGELGMNDDGHGRCVLDGVMSHVACAGKVFANHRFGVTVPPWILARADDVVE